MRDWFTCSFPHSERLRRTISPRTQIQGFFNATPMELSHPHIVVLVHQTVGTGSVLSFPKASSVLRRNMARLNLVKRGRGR